MNLVTFADNAPDNDGRVEVSLEYIIDDWINSNYQGDVSVSRVVGLCDSDDTSGKNIGHLVSFETNGIPSGYIVLSREEEDYPIVEFALSGESVYDRLEAQIATNSEAISIAYSNDETPEFSIAAENVLYTNFINYSLAITNDECVLLFDQYNNIREFEGNLPNNGIETYASIYDGYVTTPYESTTYTSGVITGGNSNAGLVMGDYASYYGEGNCGPTAATNIVNLYAKYKLNNNSRAFPILIANDNLKFTYDRLATLCEYTCTDATNPSKMLTGLDSYVSERGRTYSYDTYSYNYWSDYTRDVKKNVPILLATYAEDGGHAQVVVGYREYSNGNKYLMAYTGWTNNATYIKFKASCFTGFYGYAIYIS